MTTWTILAARKRVVTTVEAGGRQAALRVIQREYGGAIQHAARIPVLLGSRLDDAPLTAWTARELQDRPNLDTGPTIGTPTSTVGTAVIQPPPDHEYLVTRRVKASKVRVGDTITHQRADQPPELGDLQAMPDGPKEVLATRVGGGEVWIKVAA